MESNNELIARAKGGDAAAKDELMTMFIAYISSTARKMEGKGLDSSDLVNEGYIGLATAISKYDPGEGKDFRSFAAIHIRRAMLDAIAEYGSAQRLTPQEAKTASRINMVASAFEQENGRMPSLEELADIAGVAREKVEDSIRRRTRYLSADAPLANRQSTSLIDVIADKDASLPDANLISEGDASSVRAMMDVLNEREQKVIAAYYGIGQTAETLAEIGNRLGLKRERVRQIRDKAVRRIKKLRPTLNPSPREGG